MREANLFASEEYLKSLTPKSGNSAKQEIPAVSSLHFCFLKITWVVSFSVHVLLPLYFGEGNDNAEGISHCLEGES